MTMSRDIHRQLYNVSALMITVTVIFVNGNTSKHSNVIETEIH